MKTSNFTKQEASHLESLRIELFENCKQKILEKNPWLIPYFKFCLKLARGFEVSLFSC